MRNSFRKNINYFLITSLSLYLTGIIVIFGVFYYSRLSGKENNHLLKGYESILNHDSIPANAEIEKASLLNTLIDKFKYETYLEIGQGKAENNLNRIKCKVRIGVDPDKSCNAAYSIPSDEFFEVNKASFDLIFIDGLHHQDQVQRDIRNALKCLNMNGTIVVHDCNPTTEEMQIVPQRQSIWTGDVWKAWVKLRSSRSDLEMFVLANAGGCGIIRYGEQKTISVSDNLTYQYLFENRSFLLNLLSINDFLLYLKKH